jgi:hypothetical protein
MEIFEIGFKHIKLFERVYKVKKKTLKNGIIPRHHQIS